VDQAKAWSNARDTGVVPGPRTSSGGAEFHDCRRSEDDTAAMELWVKSVLTMGQPIDANEPQARSASRDDRSPVAATNLHGQEADPLTALKPSSSSCHQLDQEVSEMVGVASTTEHHSEATRVWPH
jgi:hypothetical protein